MASHTNVSLELKDLDARRFAAIGISVSLATDAACYPLELLKTRVQMMGGRADYASLARSVLAGSGGWRGLFRGAPLSLVGVAPTQLAYYGTYEGLKELGGGSLGAILVAGTLAEVAAGVVYVPLDIASQRMMLPECPPRVTGRAILRSIWASEGVRGLYRGFGATLLTHVPVSGVGWVAYEWGKHVLSNASSSPSPPLPPSPGGAAAAAAAESAWIQLTAGAFSGLLAAVASHPFDLARTRIQLAAPDAPRLGTFATMDLIARKEGLATLLGRGLAPRILFFVPTSAVGYAAYEIVKTLSVAR